MTDIPEVIRDILAKRGVSPEEMVTFLYPDYETDVGDPWLLTDMKAAIDRIERAARMGERVAVYGDYDIDGITASAVMLESLKEIGIEGRSYIPDRFEEGYGINVEALKKLREAGTDLVISVDCGITSVEEAKWASENGLDLIITDHHTVPEVIPEAIAVINPKRPGDKYSFQELAGVGVAFKVAQALQSRTGRPGAGQEKWLLDLVALGTVCDLVPLIGENRVLTSYGLKVMRKTRRIGLLSLAAVSNVNIRETASEHLGFRFGPRMNAAGRLDNAACSLELVRTTDKSRADEIAAQLEDYNLQRRETQEKIFNEADRMARELERDPVLVLASPGWSHGVVGIVASKLVEKWHKPVLVAQTMDEITKGSGRSVAGFNLTGALRANEGILSKFGGHYFAAGFTVPTKNLDDLRKGLNKSWESREDVGDGEAREADITAVDFEGLDISLLDTIALLEPFGHSNRRPVFELKHVTVVEMSTVGSGGKHLKAILQDVTGRRLGAIGFGIAGQYKGIKMGQRLTAKGELNKNDFLGRVTPQLVISEFVDE